MASTASASTSDGRDVLRWSDAATGKMSDLPHARGGAAVAHWELASQELLYMYGGCSVVQCYDQLLRLDLHRGKWAVEQVRGTPPKKRKGATLNLLGRSLDEQVLLVVGGWSADGPVPNGIKQYSIAHNTWEHRAFQGTPPPDRWAHTATSIDPEHVIVFGGEGTTPGQYLNDVYLFSLAEGEWRHLHPSGDERGGSERLLPTGRMGHTATLIQTPTSHALYIFGGYTTATRGMRQHRVATNDLWALDLRGGLATQRRDSPSSDYLKWVRVDTIGKPPAARGHHAAVSSAQGGNLFVAFGCDATEMVCYDDAYMLDTTYPQGHYWQQLPVGMLRPAPRQMLTAWVHEASLIVSGGCTPAQDSANDHCYSDVWELPLEGLMQGGKQLNATVHVVEEEAGLVVHTNGHSAQAASARLAGSSSSSTSSGSGSGSTSSGLVVAEELSAAADVSVSDANATAAAARGGKNVTGSRGGAVVGAPNATAAASEGAAPLYVDTSLNDGVDVLSAAVLGDADREEVMCQLSNISRCRHTYVASTHGAKEMSLRVEDTQRLTIGRIIRINPGGDNEEDNQIMGFGERVLTPEQKRLLALAAARQAADGAVEGARHGTGGDQGADADADADADAARSPTRRRLATAFLQLQARSSALLPDAFAKRFGHGGGRAVPQAPTVQLHVEEGAEAGAMPAMTLSGAVNDPATGASSWSPMQGGASVPYEASRRVHGRALHRHLNLRRELRFAHKADEPVVQLPASVTAMDAAPGMQHMAGERSVHRQYNDDDAMNPLVILQQARQSPPPPSPPSLPPSPPAPPDAPPPNAKIFVAEDVMYEYDEKEGVGHVSDKVSALSAKLTSGGAISDIMAAGRSRVAALSAVSAQGFVEDTVAAFGALPLWALICSIVGAVALLLFLLWCCVRGGSSSGKKKKGLEDINPVFQTETWRKAE